MSQPLILKALNPGPSFSVHLRFCYGVLIWTRCWITVSEHSLSSIGGTSKPTFILQPSLYHICESIHRRTESYRCSLIFRQWLAFTWILVRQSGSPPKGHGQFYGAVDGGRPRKEESWVIQRSRCQRWRREWQFTWVSCQAHTGYVISVEPSFSIA